MLVAVAVPAILVVNGFRILATDTFVEWELGRDGFPADPYGLGTEQRTALARTGLRSIQPGSEGIVLLERATLPDGSPAFGERELSHMDDVRWLFGAALRAQLVAVIAIAVLALVLLRTRLRGAVPAGLLAGSLATLAIAALAVPVILLGFDGFFTRFHEVFFSGDLPMEQVAIRLAAYEPVKRTLSREELVEAVRRIMAVEGDEGELDELIDLVQANVPHPAVTDLIYWPPEGKDLTPEEVVEQALTYQPRSGEA